MTDSQIQIFTARLNEKKNSVYKEMHMESTLTHPQPEQSPNNINHLILILILILVLQMHESYNAVVMGLDSSR